MEKSNIVIGSDFAAVHAYLCADGYVCKNPLTQKHKYYRVGLRNTCPELLVDFQTKFKNVFHKKPIISKQKDRCSIGNKEIYRWLTNNFGSFYSANWSISECFLKRELISQWLCAFFDCEGWVEVVKGKNRAVAADSVNAKGLNGIQQHLRKFFAINSTIRLKNGRSTSRLGIYGKTNLIKFQKFIGFNHPCKKQKLDEAINSFADFNWKFPTGEQELKEFVRTFLKQRVKSSNRRIKICSNKKKNINKLSKLLKNLFCINSVVSKARFNGVGTRYFELTINSKEEISKFMSVILA